MTEWTGVSYLPSGGWLARMDPRAKLGCLVLVGLSGVRAEIAGLLMLTVVLAACVGSAKVKLNTVRREIRYFVILLAIVFLARLFFTPGNRPEALPWLPVSREGAVAGWLVCWRLSLVIVAGMLLVVTTRSREIQAAVCFFLRPVPGIPERRVATMLGLTARLIPVVLGQAGQTAEALKARGVEQRKNPVFRLTAFAIPMIRRCFETADKMAVAMEARCYSDDRTQPALSFSRRDGLAVGVVGVVSAAAALL